MKNKYELSNVGGFWEVFNLSNKTTVYVSEDKAKCVKVLSDLQKGKLTEAELR
jgi:hypothetical protein|tara:strand:- start:376 stop:534 length:159 start_codon:yes stop_codon:yes gene_type:complete